MIRYWLTTSDYLTIITSMEQINTVRDGYRKVADAYRETKDDSQIEFHLIKKFIDNPDNTYILELGCASGYPVGKRMIDAGKNYVGVDLHISLAHRMYPDHRDKFVESEMLLFLKNQPDASLTGVFSMFSIFHLPRELHRILFENIYRVLKPNGQLLIDCFPNDCSELIATDWLEADTKMFWSCYSVEDTKKMLTNVGFTITNESMYRKEFDGKMEETMVLLMRKES